MRAVRPIRVCYLIDELATAGTETQLLALIRNLDRTRVQPFLALLRGDNSVSQALEPVECPVLRLGVGSLRSPRTATCALRFIQFLWRMQIDVVQVYFPDSSYFGILTSWLAGVPRRLRTRNNIGHWLTPTHRYLGRVLNWFTTATIANCGAARDALIRDEKPDPSLIHILPNGVDLDRFLTLTPPRMRMHQIGAVANLRPVKGLDLLIEAARRLQSDFPTLQYRIAGEGEERSRLTEQIQACGLTQHFHLCGVQNDVSSFLSDLDLAVLPSRAEGMSNAVLEYMASARPIVATGVGAIPEMLRDGIDALLVPPNDVAALASAMRRLITDRDLGHRLATSARQRAREQFSRSAMVQRFEAFYEQLMSDLRGRSIDVERTRCAN